MRIRPAASADLPVLHSLDAVCFPAGDPDLEPAEPTELADGVRNGGVLVMDDGGQTVAFLHYVLLSSQHAYLNAVAVRPDRRRGGVARALVDHFLRVVRNDNPGASVSAVAGVGNLPIASLLLSAGFVVRTLMEDYYGPGRLGSAADGRSGA